MTKDIAAIAIFSDEFKKYHPTQYYSEFLGTKILFQFKTYKILDQDEAELNRSKNPFAFVILTALLALKKKKKREEEGDLVQLKIELAKNLLDQQFPKPVIRGLYHFIRNYVVFDEAENNRKFDSTIDSITDKRKTMGIVEVIREREIKALSEKFREEYIGKGIEKGMAGKSFEVVKNLLLQTDFTVAKIASLANVTETFVNKVKKNLK